MVVVSEMKTKEDSQDEQDADAWDARRIFKPAVGASPWTFKYGDVDVEVQVFDDGTVTKIEIDDGGGVFPEHPQYSGTPAQFVLEAGKQMRITYSVIPTVEVYR